MEENMDQTEPHKLQIPASKEEGDEKGERVATVETRKEMIEMTEYRDLCVTCNNAPICTSRKDFKRPVYFCEEFDDYVPPKKGVRVQKSASSPEHACKSPAGEISGQHLGLCLNCAHHETCTYPRPAGGIWHCEEYE